MTALKYDEFVPCLYRTNKDLCDRLDSTVCKYKDTPVYVQVEGTTLRLRYLDGLSLQDHAKFAETKSFLISPDDPDFDISSAECMYLNVMFHESLTKRSYPKINTVVYLTKGTSKNWKQGLTLNTCTFLEIDGGPSRFVTSSTLAYDYTPIHYAMSNSYPSFDKAYTDLLSQKEEGAIAISRDVALLRTKVGVVFVYYRTDAVGWIDPNTNAINLVDNELSWVVEMYLKELKIGV